MNHVILSKGEKYIEKKYAREDAFEQEIQHNSKLIFGEKSIYLDTKKLVNTQSLGGVIPDGFLFDFRDQENPEFYIVEVELEKHDFYRHIFPQLTKFFALYRNPHSLNTLVECKYTYPGTR